MINAGKKLYPVGSQDFLYGDYIKGDGPERLNNMTQYGWASAGARIAGHHWASPIPAPGLTPAVLPINLIVAPMRAEDRGLYQQYGRYMLQVRLTGRDLVSADARLIACAQGDWGNVTLPYTPLQWRADDDAYVGILMADATPSYDTFSVQIRAMGIKGGGLVSGVSVSELHYMNPIADFKNGFCGAPWVGPVPDGASTDEWDNEFTTAKMVSGWVTLTHDHFAPMVHQVQVDLAVQTEVIETPGRNFIAATLVDWDEVSQTGEYMEMQNVFRHYFYNTGRIQSRVTRNNGGANVYSTISTPTSPARMGKEDVITYCVDGKHGLILNGALYAEQSMTGPLNNPSVPLTFPKSGGQVRKFGWPMFIADYAITMADVWNTVHWRRHGHGLW